MTRCARARRFIIRSTLAGLASLENSLILYLEKRAVYQVRAQSVLTVPEQHSARDDRDAAMVMPTLLSLPYTFHGVKVRGRQVAPHDAAGRVR